MIFKIAKAELRSIFFSPVAWFVSIVFLFMWGSAYARELYQLASFQELSRAYNPSFKDFSSLGHGFSITTLLFGSIHDRAIGVFSVAIKYLFLFVPLLTMGLISREMNNGTDKLLYSSPVRLRQIVLGKYAGIMLYNLFLLMIIGVIFLSVACFVKSPDYGFVFSAATGIFLLMCTYSAIGMFMSSLTTYQVIAAIGTFVILGLLNRIGDLWQRVDFVRDLTWFLSLPGRAEKMLYGLLTTKDLIYFLVVTAMFICFTLFRLRGQRETKPWYIKAGRYSLVLVIALFVGYISSRPTLTGYWDATATNTNTLPDSVQQIIKQFDKGPLEVTLYTNLVGSGLEFGLPENRNRFLADNWEPYLRFKSDIHFNYVYYYDYTESVLHKLMPENEQLKKQAVATAKLYSLDLSMFKTPAEIRKMADLKNEIYKPVMELKYGGQTSFLRTFDGDIPFQKKEQIMGASLKRLLHPSPYIYFLSNHYERNITKSGEREMADHTVLADNFLAMINHGFDMDTFSLEGRDVPADAAALVIADPKIRLSSEEINKLQQYIAKGGNMLILGEPGKQFVLNPLLQQLGVQLMEGQLAQSDKDETPDKITPVALDAVSSLSEAIATAYHKKKSSGEAFPLLMPGATALTSAPTSAFTVKPLFVTADKLAWLKAGKLVTDSAEVFFNAAEGDIAGSLPVAFALTRQVNGKEQRIAVAGDADFMSNMRYSQTQNIEFINALYSWMNYGVFPIYAPRPKPDDVVLYISQSAAKFHKIIFVWVLPEILLVFAVIFLIRRKRK